VIDAENIRTPWPTAATRLRPTSTLSYGATKNGGTCADGVVIFNRDPSTQQLGFLRRCNGQLYSRMCYLSAQLQPLIHDGITEKNARQANQMGAAGPSQIKSACLLFPVEINEIFIFLPESAAANPTPHGYAATLRKDRNGPHYRFVTAWNLTAAAVAKLLTAASGQAQLGGTV